MAGIDIKTQKKESSKFYSDMMERRRTREQKDQVANLEEKEKEKERKVRWDERHWSDKSLAEMTERLVATLTNTI